MRPDPLLWAVLAKYCRANGLDAERLWDQRCGRVTMTRYLAEQLDRDLGLPAEATWPVLEPLFPTARPLRSSRRMQSAAASTDSDVSARRRGKPQSNPGHACNRWLAALKRDHMWLAGQLTSKLGRPVGHSAVGAWLLKPDDKNWRAIPADAAAAIAVLSKGEVPATVGPEAPWHRFKGPRRRRS